MEVNLAALLREGAFTVHAQILRNIPEPYVGTDDMQAAVPAPTADPGPAVGMSRRGPQPVVHPKSDGETFTFICLDRQVVQGDYVLVATKYGIAMAQVTAVDSEVNIEPGDTIRYKYVVQRLDFSDYAKEMAKNEEIEKVYRSAYQNNVRRSFRQQMLSSLEDEGAKQRLIGLLK